MKIILAQGNPGIGYTQTRHNIGFRVLEALTDWENVRWKTMPKLHAYIAEVTLNDEKVVLVRPTTFYNETGRAAQAIIHFYKIDQENDFLVIHDDLALPFGTLRVRQKGSDAGNNGIKSINAEIGENYWRLRIGIWNELRNRMDDAAFVLSSFSGGEQKALHETVIPHALQIIDIFTKGDIEAHSHQTTN